MTESTARAIRTAQIGLLINAVLVVVKIVTGVVGHSYALVADGVESSLDIFSSLIVWRGLYVAGQSADRDHHFGHGKAEAVASAAVAVLLMAAAIGIAIQAVREILTPHHAPAPFTLIVLVIVVAIKERWFRRVLHAGRELGSVAITSDAWHHRSDAITSGAAFLGITIALIGGDAWVAADEGAAIIAAAIILANGVRLLRPAVADLMDTAPDEPLLERIAAEARAEDGVRAVEKVLARRAGVGFFVVLHVEADPDLSLRAAHEIGGRVRSRLLREVRDVLDVIIHMEPHEPDRSSAQRAPPSRLYGHRPRGDAGEGTGAGA